MAAPRRPRGFTLLETLVAAGVMGIVFGAGYFLFLGGARGATVGMAQDAVLSAAVGLTESLAADVEQMVVRPHRAGRQAVRVSRSGRRMALLVADRSRTAPVLPRALADRPSALATGPTPLTTDDWVLTARPVVYRPVRRPGGLLNAARDDRVLDGVVLSTWRFALVTDPRSIEAALSRPTTPSDLEPQTEASFLAPLLAGPPPPGGRAPKPVELVSATLTGSFVDPATGEVRPGAPAASVRTTLVSTPAARVPGGPVSPLMLAVRFEAIDPERRVAERRTLLFDLDTARLLEAYAQQYPIPDWMIDIEAFLAGLPGAAPGSGRPRGGAAGGPARADPAPRPGEP